MVKKKVKKDVKNFIKKIKNAAALSLDKILYDNIKEYSEYVLEDRALPAWQDGLKPSQRRLLWALYHNLNSKPDKTYLKCARITGQAMLYHPHGESYQTLVNMIEGTPCPLLYGLGNFGSYSSYNPAGASRYCFRGDTLIATDSGLRRIESMGDVSKKECIIDDNVLTYDGYHPAAKWINSGVRDLYLVRTQYGTVVATDNEPFMVMNASGEWEWKDLSNLVIGDVIIRQRKDYSFGHGNKLIDFEQAVSTAHNYKKIEISKNYFDEEVAEWLGFVISEGTHSPYEISVSMSSRKLMKRYYYLCQAIFGSNVDIRKKTRFPRTTGWQRKKCYEVTLKGSGYSQFLAYLGQPIGNSFNRRIPDFILGASRSEVTVFLRALFEGDGSTTHNGHISYSTRSAELAMNIQAILMMFGIKSSLSSNIKRHMSRSHLGKIRGVSGKPPEIKLTIAADSTTDFFSMIGFLEKTGVKEKNSHLGGNYPSHPALRIFRSRLHRDRAKYFTSNKLAIRNKRDGYIPSSISPLSAFPDESKASVINNIPVLESWFDLNKKTLRGWPDIYDFLKKNIKSFYTDVLLDITPINPDITYDLTVPGPHAFTANGFVAHNTEAKSSEFTIATFFDSRFLPVMEMVSNYDSSATEPVYLPAQLPIVLALGSTGIAVGVTTDIPAFTVPSLIKAVQLALREKNYTVPTKKLMNTLEFASAYGGKLDEAASEIKSVLETGVGTISWECDYDVVKDEVNIYGFPPGWNFDTKMAAIQKIPDVATCVDISAGRDIHVKVTFRQVDRDKKDAAIKKVVSLLRSKKHHKLNVMTRYLQKDDVIDFTRGEFESISVQSLLAKWVAYRVDLERKALTAEIEKLSKDLEKYELLKLAADNIDIIFKILKTKGVDKVKELSKKLKITAEQSATIWQIPVGRLDRLSSSEFVKNIQETKDKIKSVKKRLKAPEDSILSHMKENMKALANPIAYHPES